MFIVEGNVVVMLKKEMRNDFVKINFNLFVQNFKLLFYYIWVFFFRGFKLLINI